LLLIAGKKERYTFSWQWIFYGGDFVLFIIMAIEIIETKAKQYIFIKKTILL